MPGGSANDVWTAYLDEIAAFAVQLNGIPVIFRLFHEMTGWWFWWGIETCEADEFIDAWQYTVHYLREKGASNILYFYATSRVYSTNETEAKWTEKNMRLRYPGNDYVDIVGFDCYDNLTNFAASLEKSCDTVFAFAEEYGKIPAIGETGHTDGTDCTNCAEWWGIFERTMRNESHLCHKAAYAITWENYGPTSYSIPLKEDTQWPGFIGFYEGSLSVFASSEEWTKAAAQSGYLSGGESLRSTAR